MLTKCSKSTIRTYVKNYVLTKKCKKVIVIPTDRSFNNEISKPTAKINKKQCKRM